MAGRSALSALNDHKIFQVFREGLTEKISRTYNLLDCKDDVLYMWHAPESCLLTLNIKTLETERNLKYQKLVGTEIISFNVTNVMVHPISTWVAISGSRGVSVVRLPRRSGPQALFQGGRDTIMCKSYIYDERIYMSECEIYRVRWLPNSTTDSHLIVLGSDNTIRLYDACDDEQPLKQIWRVGRKGGRLPLLAALGDSAVDVYPDNDERALLLTGNGNVHLMDIKEKNNKSFLEGPLTMYPAADDNYGLESCSVLKLGNNLISIATCGGTLYHCIIISDEEEYEDKFNYLAQKSLFKAEKQYSKEKISHTLYVVEAIELDLGLNLNDDDPSYTCPIYLVPDEGLKNRYFCFHETGVHIVTVPLVNQLETFFNSIEDNVENNLPTLNSPSVVEYAICTKTSKIDATNPPLGLCITYSTHALISILADGRLVIKLLTSDGPEKMLFNEAIDMKLLSNKSNLNTSLNEMQKVPFSKQIQNILKHELTQPILKISNTTEPNPQECLELLTHATSTFREDHFVKLESALREVEKRVRTLILLKKLQLQEIEEWTENKTFIVSEAKRLNEKCTNAIKAQQELNKRCENVLRCLRYKLSAPSAAEETMAKELDAYNKMIPFYQSELEKVKQKQNVQQAHIKNWDASRKKEEVFLGKHLSEIIKNSLGQQTKQIGALIDKINIMKLDIDLK